MLTALESDMRVLIPVFVREFYLANTGFFLLVIAFAGGFMRSYDHIALAEFFISSPLVLIIPIGFWFLYNLKVINFNWERIKQNENEFIFCFMLFPLSKQWWMAIRVVLIQLLPAFIYGLFLCLLAWKHDLTNSHRCNSNSADAFGADECLSSPMVVTPPESRKESFFYRTLFQPPVHEAVSAIFY